MITITAAGETTTVDYPTVGGTLLGGTIDTLGSGVSAPKTGAPWPARMDAKVVRTYNNSDALTVPTTTPVATSYGSLLGGKGWSNNTGTVNALASALRALPDIPGVRVDMVHEFDNPTKYGTDSSTYLTDAAVFSSTVRAVSGARANPLIIFRCCMGYALTPAGRSRNIDQFYAAGDYDEVGIDVYAYGQIQLAIDFVAKYRKPLCIPEMGPLDNVDHTDPAILAYMQAGIPAFKAAGASWVAWFDKQGAGGCLNQYPNSLAYWRSQI